MNNNVEIDEGSGFCFGVTTAIKKAEEELAKGETLYCLGDIVHNGQECERLRKMGLVTITHKEFAGLRNVKVLLRAHGEPPQTYEMARRNHIEIIDATCPVVLRLQKRIKQEYDNTLSGKEKANRHFRKKRTCRGTGTGRANRRKSHRDRKHRRSVQTGFLERHSALLANDKVAR